MDPIPEIKKRGRRKKIVDNNPPKKSKISLITNENLTSLKDSTKKSITTIIHLNCSIKEIETYKNEQNITTKNLVYNPNAPDHVKPYEEDKNTHFHIVNEDTTKHNKDAYNSLICSKCSNYNNYLSNDTKNTDISDSEDSSQILTKIKDLKMQYYKNIIPNKKVDCFWCTCPYDNDTIYILQNGSYGDILAHGSFCCPECAVAYLFENMKWDDSTKMESYQLMNNCYSKNKTVSIKPAMSPYYFLDKFYGTLTIQEYRKLINSSYIMLCMDKPITRILPEIQEELDNSASTSNTNRGNYKVKKNSEKVPTQNRNTILKNNFLIAV
jgi:hypothetical protein